MVTVPASYVLDDQTVDQSHSFDVQPTPPIESRGTNEATFRAVISSASPDHKEVLQALYRELVLANYAEFDGKRGSSAEPELSKTYPDTGTLPRFIRTSGRYNAAGMILHNLLVQKLRIGRGYQVLPALLNALVQGGALEPPRCDLRPSPVTFSLPEEFSGEHVFEGAIRRITINAYERSTKAREACLAHHGYDCACCGFNFERHYGDAGRRIIHVHHLVPLANIGSSYRVDPIRDLVPICPNCHAVIHRADPPYTLTEVNVLLQNTTRARRSA